MTSARADRFHFLGAEQHGLPVFCLFGQAVHLVNRIDNLADTFRPAPFKTGMGQGFKDIKQAAIALQNRAIEREQKPALAIYPVFMGG